MNILVVDDDIHTVLALTNLLQHDHALRIASNGEDALTLFSEGRFDAVVTDIRMPRMNGIELLKAVRSTDPCIPVIIISGHSTPGIVAEAVQCGAQAFFTKPLDVGGFMSVLYNLEKNTA